MTITQVFGVLTTVLSYISTILGIVGTTAQETERLIIQNIAAAAANTVNSPTYGNHALLTAINGVNDQVIAAATSLTVQIVKLTDGTTPVSLPVTPPSGYQAPSSADNASDVWHYSLSPFDFDAGYYLFSAGNAGAYEKFRLWENADQTYFIPVFNNSIWPAGVSADYPTFAPTDILETEDILTCLARQNASAVVTWGFEDGGPALLTFSGGSDVEQWWTTFDAAGFAFLKAQVWPSTTVNIAPVWPGIANVTLGSPVAITSALTVSGPMDGVIVDITSVAPRFPALAYGGETAYKFIGACSFVSDNGDVEPFQQLGFQTAVYCPSSLKQADSFVLRADPSVVGTVTPWVAV